MGSHKNIFMGLMEEKDEAENTKTMSFSLIRNFSE
jgi:hypothetical protein